MDADPRGRAMGGNLPLPRDNQLGAAAPKRPARAGSFASRGTSHEVPLRRSGNRKVLQGSVSAVTPAVSDVRVDRKDQILLLTDAGYATSDPRLPTAPWRRRNDPCGRPCGPSGSGTGCTSASR